ncbi:MAG TPA: M20/M25/M40 family metallo-hydrolase [Pseudobdellovibrionaceae bacterium]|nr:M20/M25/M40 family metallo-hydrolase [Pseudobdellovibrionaceae bacterium]
MDFLEASRRFIGIDSSPAAGTVAIASEAAQLARSLGLRAELYEDRWAGVDQANVLVRPNIETSVGEELLLLTHLDTPDPGAYGLWRKTGANPFNASIYPSPDGDEIHGLGTADVKLDFLCKLRALDRVIREGGRWRRRPVLVGSYGEEMGMPGAVKLVRKKLVNARQAVVGEPTQMQLIVAGKGFASVEIELPFSEDEMRFRAEHDLHESSSTQSRMFAGRAAHSSSPGQGESAIEKMFAALEMLPEGVAIMSIEGGVNFNTVPAHAVIEIDVAGGLRDSMTSKLVDLRRAIRRVESRFAQFPDAQFDPAEPTMNIGLIRTLEDHVKVQGCVRLPPTVSETEYESWMKLLRDACAQRGGVFRIGDYKRPFRTSTDSEIVKLAGAILSDMGYDATPKAQAVANEANVLSRFGMDCIVWGAGQGVGNSHTPNEYVKLHALEAASEFYAQVIRRSCLE